MGLPPLGCGTLGALRVLLEALEAEPSRRSGPQGPPLVERALVPACHGCRSLLAPGAQALAERLAAAGWQCAGGLLLDEPGTCENAGTTVANPCKQDPLRCGSRALGSSCRLKRCLNNPAAPSCTSSTMFDCRPRPQGSRPAAYQPSRHPAQVALPLRLADPALPHSTWHA